MNDLLYFESMTYGLESESVLSFEAAREEVDFPLSKCKPLSNIENYQFEERYMCNDEGVVISTIKVEKGIVYGYIIKPYINRDHYVEYVLKERTGKMRHINAHRIVAELFLPPVEGKQEVNHIDGNRQNNKLSNLEWSSRSENIKHSYDVVRNSEYKFKRRSPILRRELKKLYKS